MFFLVYVALILFAKGVLGVQCFLVGICNLFLVFILVVFPVPFLAGSTGKHGKSTDLGRSIRTAKEQGMWVVRRVMRNGFATGDSNALDNCR